MSEVRAGLSHERAEMRAVCRRWRTERGGAARDTSWAGRNSERLADQFV